MVSLFCLEQKYYCFSSVIFLLRVYVVEWPVTNEVAALGGHTLRQYSPRANLPVCHNQSAAPEIGCHGRFARLKEG
jgi:hypothetical protein